MLIFFAISSGFPEFFNSSVTSSCSLSIIDWSIKLDSKASGFDAARLSGSGIGIGLQAKGTAVIHQKDRLPHNNLELFSNAPLTKLLHYELMGFNSTQYAKETIPEPIIVQTKGEALGARFHARVALTYAIETSLIVKDESPEEILPIFKDYQ